MSLGRRPVQAGECQGAGQAPERLVGRVELLDLLDRRPPPEPRQAADQLQVDEVAGGQRVGFAAAEEAQALDGPGADLRNRQQPRVAAGLAGPDSGRAAIWRATAAQGDRAFRREVRSPRVRPARARRSAAAEGRRCSCARPAPSRGAPAADDAALDRAARPVSISCLTTAQASASQGHGRRRGAQPGRRRISRPEQRVAAEAAVELGEVVVDPEREAHPLDRPARARPRRPGRGSLDRRAAARDRGRVDGSARSATRPAAGCQARTRTGLPSTCSRRVATPPRIAHHAVLAAVAAAGRYGRRRGLTSTLHGSRRLIGGAQRPSRWTSTRKERLATTFGRSARAGASGAAGSGCGSRPRRPRGRRRRSRRRPGRPPAAAIAARAHLGAQDRRAGLRGRPRQRPDRLLGRPPARRPPRRATSPSRSNSRSPASTLARRMRRHPPGAT